MSEYIITDEQVAENRRLHGKKLLVMPVIVRCCDCVYNAKDTDGICYRFDHEHFNQPDGFCKWGERRERESAEVWNPWSADDVTCSEES